MNSATAIARWNLDHIARFEDEVEARLLVDGRVIVKDSLGNWRTQFRRSDLEHFRLYTRQASSFVVVR